MVAVIIPTYSSLDTLKVLVQSLKNHSVYVIEDGQNEETARWLQTQDVRAIYHLKNMGVAPSWNDGIKQAIQDGFTHFAVFNDDIEVPENWWDVCKKEFDEGAHLVSLSAPCPQLIIRGWFFVLDKTCIDTLGLFDEQFVPFLGEDTDYEIRFMRSKLKYALVDLDVKHKSSATLNKIKEERPEYYELVRDENERRLFKKYPTMVRL